MRRMMSPVLLALILLSGPAAEGGVEGVGLPGQARNVLRRHCWRCHSGPGSQGGDFNVLNAAQVRDAGLVVAGKPDESELLTRILHEQMPPIGVRHQQPVTAPEAEVLRQWISASARDFPQAEGRKWISIWTVMDSVRAWLREQDPADRRYMRFFTLHHLYNNPNVLDEDLPAYRAALSKALNSLSWRPRIVLPVALEDDLPDLATELHATVFAFDLRQVNWDGGPQWASLLKRYPYGLGFKSLSDSRLWKTSEELWELTGTELPVLRADWFVTTATRAPLYDALLGLPNTARELEQKLGVDLLKDFLKPVPERIARAGFSRSGISSQNRLVQRSDASYGAYWKSYDFKPDTGRARLTRFPLGPLNLFPAGKHPWPAQAFEHDGGEIAFNLPNGLQGYMLTDGHGARIDSAPVDVVSDPLRTSGTPIIVNGVSCIACHQRGVVDFHDSIRTGSSVFGDAEYHVKKLYPARDQMDRLIDEDQQRFLAAISKTTGPFLRDESQATRPIESFPEPVGEVARLHRLVSLDLQTIACELGIADPQELVTAVGAKTLKKLGLDSLLQGGTISRAEWEAFDGPSLMQSLARELRYTPVRPL